MVKSSLWRVRGRVRRTDRWARAEQCGRRGHAAPRSLCAPQPREKRRRGRRRGEPDGSGKPSAALFVILFRFALSRSQRLPPARRSRRSALTSVSCLFDGPTARATSARGRDALGGQKGATQTLCVPLVLPFAPAQRRVVESSAGDGFATVSAPAFPAPPATRGRRVEAPLERHDSYPHLVENSPRFIHQ